MFRARSRDSILTVRDADGVILAEAPSAMFPYEEAGIICSSIEFYHDPEPCEIHRGAIISRTAASFKMVCSAGQTVDVRTLEPLLQALLPPQAATVQLKEV